ncbi:hypothetical protein M413DRAFT_22970 [Hebeloma cylindrosporum]|uniref:Uncharacterized protein n=1 Tax=Hebeloma cylindrosporum TaxID=76867 RepID=A0A0C2Z5K6_HEBCY|nr:hypothetical protein M413DRAFT_22970 [Hebeloma cylindrosporum h7]
MAASSPGQHGLPISRGFLPVTEWKLPISAERRIALEVIQEKLRGHPQFYPEYGTKRPTTGYKSHSTISESPNYIAGTSLIIDEKPEAKKAAEFGIVHSLTFTLKSPQKPPDKRAKDPVVTGRDYPEVNASG